jgi:glutamine cyclotransferase
LMPLRYTYRIINTYPHDPTAFTEGLFYDGGFLYESTGGLYGPSSLRRVELASGNVLQLYSLPAQYFGEGITLDNDTIVQLTWRSNIGFVYEKNTFNLLRNFTYSGEGWGLTTDGNSLVMSNGTAYLTFLNPQTFQVTGTVKVLDNATPVTMLNELEYVHGDIYANIWLTNKIAIINPQTGQVKAYIDLTGIPDSNSPDINAVLNGIAYDSQHDRLFITGKMWSHLYEIKLVPTPAQTP